MTYTAVLEILMAAVFLSIIFLHVAKKNVSAVVAYALQSLAIVLLLLSSFLTTRNPSLLLIALLVFLVKVVLMPASFIRLIKKHELAFSVSTYLNTPLTLMVLAGLTAMASLAKFAPLTGLLPGNQELLSLALAGMFLSLFMMINRKGVLSQIAGFLSLENSILAFAFFAGLEQAPALQIGIIFDISVWVVIAAVFTSMIYKHFGSLDVSEMRHLKED